MINRKLDVFIEHHYASSRNALYLYGARQVGKSYAIRKYAQAHFPIYMLMFMHRKERAPQAIYNLELPDFMK